MGRALDQGGGVREVARRMLTNFTVQASVSEFDSAQRTLKEASAKALPQVRRGEAPQHDPLTPSCGQHPITCCCNWRALMKPATLVSSPLALA